MHYKQLTLEQRYQIKAFFAVGFSVSFTAKSLKVHRSTIYREQQRNSGPRNYQSKIAHEKAILRRKYSKKKKRLTPEMKNFIRDKLKASWSPEQIYGYCKKHGIDMVCHETIYKYIAKNKAHVNTKSYHPYQDSPFNYACRNGLLKTVKLLVLVVAYYDKYDLEELENKHPKKHTEFESWYKENKKNCWPNNLVILILNHDYNKKSKEEKNFYNIQYNQTRTKLNFADLKVFTVN